MPGLAYRVCVIEEVFENKADNREEETIHLLNRHSKSNFYQNSTVMNHVKSIPTYQEVLLLTECHLMRDSEPLPMYLWNSIADMVRILLW